ncbi:MAG: family 20 glycosylhydrolase [Porphyromonadaceae bacterium]|nr:family 20 glycosylhydrolase [Porphyromonadaceae bacterium]
MNTNALSLRVALTRAALLFVCLLCPLGLSGQELTLLPRPQQYNAGRGVLSARQLRLDVPCLRAEATELLTRYGYQIGSHYRTACSIRLVDSLPAPRGLDEAYRLKVSAEGITIEAIEELGAYRALQTLDQLLEAGGKFALRHCDILDWPAWRIRGLMHDVGRTFIPLSELKRQIALLARFKVNVFHWHLTENQAWRLESKLYPQLNSIAATERMPGYYYTLAEARELADWCRAHRVLLIPEIDMPGHSAAFERAMGCTMQSAEGISYLKTLLREALEAMDVPYIHIGTDEVEFTNPNFVPEMVAYIRGLGRKVISWNPGWDYKAGEVDMTQLWGYRGTPLSGVPAIDSRLHYINHYDLFADPIALYASSILRAPHGSDELAGAILGVWNDRFVRSSDLIMAENNVYANMLALAERAWLGGGFGYFDEHATLLRSRKSELYRAFDDFERRLLWHKGHSLSREPIPYIRQTEASWLISPAFPNEGELSRVFAPETTYLAKARRGQLAPPPSTPRYTVGGASQPCTPFIGSGGYLRHVWGERLVPGILSEPRPNHTAYAMAWIHSPTRQTVGLRFETQNYSRSESDLPPPQGAWDYRESRIWINGQEVKPPLWTNTHTERSNELPLDNENAVARPPLPITLRAGWNAVLIKLPVGEFSTRETRLVKWMFTASFVTLDGRAAAPVRYHHFE